MVLPGYPNKIWGKSVSGLLGYDRTNKQTNRDYNFIYIDYIFISRVGWGWRYPESGVGGVPAGVPGEFEEKSWGGEGKHHQSTIWWGHYPIKLYDGKKCGSNFIK